MAVTVELESLRSLVMVFLQFPQRAAENPSSGVLWQRMSRSGLPNRSDKHCDFSCPSRNDQADGSRAIGRPLLPCRALVGYHIGDGPRRSGSPRQSARQSWSGAAGAGGASHDHPAGGRRQGSPLHTTLHRRGVIANQGHPDCAGRSGLHVVWFTVWAEPVRRLYVQSV
jgi:hypothetical protein